MCAIGYRKKGDNTPLYNPERDYAYITPTLMRQAIESLDANDTPERAEWRAAENITDEEICAVAEALALAQRDFVNAADPVNSFEHALLRHNFYNVRPAVRRYLFAVMGEVFCAAWFKAVREVSVVGDESPAQTDMSRFCATVRDFVNKRVSQVYDANSVAERMRMMVDVVRAREEDLRAQVHAQNQELVRAHEKIVALSAKLNKPTIWSNIKNVFRKKTQDAKV